jgi:hypothetical protein
MAHAYAQDIDTAPWQALLDEVSRGAGIVAFLQMKIGEETRDDADLLPTGTMGPWVAMYERERDRLSRNSKMAIDGGVAELLARTAQVDGAELASLVNKVLGDPALPEEIVDVLRAAFRRELLEMDAREAERAPRREQAARVAELTAGEPDGADTGGQTQEAEIVAQNGSQSVLPDSGFRPASEAEALAF